MPKGFSKTKKKKTRDPNVKYSSATLLKLVPMLHMVNGKCLQPL